MTGTLKGVHSERETDAGQFAERPHLFLVMDAARPLSGGARFSLDGVHEVLLGRGERLSAQRTKGGRKLVISVPDPFVSTRHARLVMGMGFWGLSDDGSTNGLFLEGARVTGRAVVRDGAVFDMGSTLFRLRTSLPTPDHSPRDTDRTSAATSDEPGLTTLLPAFAASIDALTRVAPSRVPVLLLGPTGVGKELVARAVHKLSGRRGTLVPINCGALAETLVHALLFGHTKGAFSGALKDELGLVRASHEGTLFLDEIGDMTREAQTAVLRVLQEGEVVPVGATRAVQVDLRVIAATHRRVDAEDPSDFRRDLYARVAGYTHEIPPLGQRLEDLGLLVGDLLRKVAPEPSAVRLSLDLGRAMLAYDWPLNVRELEHSLSSAVVLAAGRPLALAHLPPPVRSAVERAAPRAKPSQRSKDDERVYRSLVGALEETGGNVSEVARRLGHTRMQIHRWLRRFGVDVEKYRVS